jgi:choline dehydrogenase-like flavoprotein
MGKMVRESVVDSFGKMHGSPNLFVAGGSNFVGTSGAVNPTLTMVALALRTADFIGDQFS